jgi:hypothetical protein
LLPASTAAASPATRNRHFVKPCGQKIRSLIAPFHNLRECRTFAFVCRPAQAKRCWPHTPSILTHRAYPAAWAYTGRYQFKKHFFSAIGELKSEGEEFDCAQLLDNLAQVHYWIRNLSGRPKSSFWLPTSTDRFYPDFVARLTDGRILVVEYKGADRVTTDDTKEKRNIGKLWAAKSNGKGLFVMAEKRNAEGLSLAGQIGRAVG